MLEFGTKALETGLAVPLELELTLAMELEEGIGDPQAAYVDGLFARNPFTIFPDVE